MITKKPREFILKLTEVEAESIALQLKMNHNTSISLILYAKLLHFLTKPTVFGHNGVLVWKPLTTCCSDVSSCVSPGLLAAAAAACQRLISCQDN